MLNGSNSNISTKMDVVHHKTLEEAKLVHCFKANKKKLYVFILVCGDGDPTNIFTLIQLHCSSR